MSNTVLEVKQVSKNFGNTKALNNLSFSVGEGEIFGLVGANGSGKSTLMNLLFGNSVISETGGYRGEVLIDHKIVNIKTAVDAIGYGIGMIHQEFILVPDMTVSENIKLTRENTKHSITKVLGRKYSYLDKKKDIKESKNVLERLGYPIECDWLVRNISVNAKQFVEIAREIHRDDLKMLFLDEPTAVLNHEDAKVLLGIIKELSSQGVSIVFCTHRLHEICEICDRVMVMRDGEKISEYTKEEMNIKTLAHDMMGYDISVTRKAKRAVSGDKILQLQNFSVDMPGEFLRDITIDVCKGEILGVTSLSGHGKLAIGYGMMGMFETSGQVSYKGNDLDVRNIHETIAKGIFLLPDDRKNMGLLLEHSVKDNILFSYKHKSAFFYNKKEKENRSRFVQNQIERLDIKCESEVQYTKELSGGNQQKVCIARANAVGPEVLFVLEPTRGVDVGAKERILDMLVEMNEKEHRTIIVISSELEELKRISDRIVVLCEGTVSNILSPEATEGEFALAYTGDINDDK